MGLNFSKNFILTLSLHKGHSNFVSSHLDQQSKQATWPHFEDFHKFPLEVLDQHITHISSFVGERALSITFIVDFFPLDF